MFKRWFGESCSTSNNTSNRNTAEENTIETMGNSNSINQTTRNSNSYGARSYSMTERSNTCSITKAETEVAASAQQARKFKKVQAKNRFHEKKISIFSLDIFHEN